MNDLIRNSKILRKPLLAITRALLMPLKAGLPILRRAAYDVMPIPYLVAGSPEKFIISTADKVIGREIFLHGEFDFEKMEVALSILKRENRPTPRHLIDVGANIGTILIPALKRGYFSSAIAIEPHPENLCLLKANIELNEVSEKVEVFEMAVGSRKDENLFLKISDTNSGNHYVSNVGIRIHSTRLDDLNIKLDNALLWMDIEGYEGHALQGASALLATGVPLVSEFNPTYLSASGGLEVFVEILKNRKIFDLKHPNEMVSFEYLRNQYKKDFTDILAIPV